MKQIPADEFREFVNKHSDSIFNHAFRMLGNREDAGEAVQDIFMKAYNGMAGFRGDSNIGTWLYRITVNTCLTRLRKKTHEHVHPDAEKPESGSRWESLKNPDETPADMVIEKDTADFLMRALETIPAGEKEILLLFHVDELKYEEIAGVLEIPLGTVCARLYRARKKLRVAMGALTNEPTR